ncbi:hypothetical protein U0070_009609, partial [Myodes glareolus]
GRYATRRRTAPSSQLVAQGTTLSKQQPAGVLTSEMWPRLLPQIGGAYSWAGSCVSTPQRGAWPFRCARLVAGDQLVCAPLTWAGARHRRMAASRKPPRVRAIHQDFQLRNLRIIEPNEATPSGDKSVERDHRMAPKVTSELLRQLRQAMRNAEYVAEPIQAYIIPSGDAHQTELPPYSQVRVPKFLVDEGLDLGSLSSQQREEECGESIREQVEPKAYPASKLSSRLGQRIELSILGEVVPSGPALVFGGNYFSHWQQLGFEPNPQPVFSVSIIRDPQMWETAASWAFPNMEGGRRVACSPAWWQREDQLPCVEDTRPACRPPAG